MTASLSKLSTSPATTVSY